MKRPSKAKLEKQVNDWNKKHETGVDVRYWPGVREGEPKIGKTTSKAMVLGGHSAVVYIEGCGSVALSHVEALAYN